MKSVEQNISHMSFWVVLEYLVVCFIYSYYEELISKEEAQAQLQVDECAAVSGRAAEDECHNTQEKADERDDQSNVADKKED